MANNKTEYRDESHINEASDVDQSKVPSTIKKLATWIRQKMYGEDVRESIARGIEKNGEVAQSASDTANNAAQIVQNTSDNVNNVLSNITDNAGDSAAPEVIAARKPALEDKFPSLGARLDKMDKLGLTKMYFPKILNWQEDCALLNIADKWIIIDTGDDRDWGNIKSFIMAHTDHIDIGIISHYHRDHVGNVVNIIQDVDMDTAGMTWYLPQMPTNAAQMDIVSDALTNIQSAATTEIVNVVDTDLLVRLDSLTSIQFLNASEESYKHYYDVENLAYNNYSMCALIRYNTTDLFFFGDVQDGGIGWLMSNYIEYLHPVDFVKIPHHGCDTSNLANFYALIKSNYAVAMCTNNNYVNASGVESAALSILTALGTQVSYAFKSESDYVISQNSVKPRRVNSSLRGSAGSTRITYYVRQQDPVPNITDGTQEHPFASVDEMMSYVQPAKGIQYVLNFMTGNYPLLNLIDQPYNLAIYCDDNAVFEKVNIANCSSIDFMTDVHISKAGDRSINIDRSNVSFLASVINDDTDADLSSKDKSRLIYSLKSTVTIANLICNKRSAAVVASATSSVTVFKASGNDNLYGFSAETSTIYVNNLVWPFASTLRNENNGRVVYDIGWTDLGLSNGFVSDDKVQFCVRGNQVLLRGSVTNPSWQLGSWISLAALPGVALPQDGRTYRFPITASNGRGGVLVLQSNTLRIRFGEMPDLVGINVTIPLF